MNELILSYCFSKNLSTNEDRFNKALYCLKKSIDCNSKFHSIKLYTDKDTFKFVESFTDNIEIINYNDFLFLDDIKIQTLELLSSNEILIDIDIFLGDILKVNSNCDVVLDRPSYITEFYYRKEIKEADGFQFSNLLNYNVNENEIGNIGIMKFFNKDLQKKYIDFYHKVKKSALKEKDSLPPFPTFSILLGQMGLKNIIDLNNYVIGYTSKMSENNYFHLASEQKYETNIDESLSRLNKTLI